MDHAVLKQVGEQFLNIRSGAGSVGSKALYRGGSAQIQAFLASFKTLSVADISKLLSIFVCCFFSLIYGYYCYSYSSKALAVFVGSQIKAQLWVPSFCHAVPNHINLFYLLSSFFIYYQPEWVSFEP